MNDDKSINTTHNPLVVLSIVVVTTWMILAGLMWLPYRFHQDEHATAKRRQRLSELRVVIVYLDEVLTMSARMATLTGNLQWEHRYHQFESQLDAAIKDAAALAPETYSGEAAFAVDVANTKLVEMENLAFDLLRQERDDEARKILFSDDYETQKRIYVEGMRAFERRLTEAVKDADKRQRWLSFLQAGAMALVGFLLLLGWLAVFCAVRKWNTALAERKRSEDALRESEQRFIDVLYASDDAILLIDGETFVDCNEATARMLEYDNRDDFLMTHPSELSPPEQPDGRSSFEKAEDMMRTAIEKGFHRFEWIHRKADGEDFPVEVSLTPITYKGRTVLHCVWRDLTDYKRTDEGRRKSESELRAIYENAPLVMLLVDSERRVVKMNTAALSMACRSKAEAIGLRGGEALRCIYASGDPQTCGFGPACEACGIRKTVMDTFQTGKAFHRVEASLSYDRPDNPVDMRVLVSTTPLALSGDTFALVCLEDVTQQRQSEEALYQAMNRAEEASQAKSCFLANMSHEIRTPMTAILGFTDILLNDLEEPTAIDAAHIVKRNGEHLLQIINDILDISKIEAGKIEMEMIRWSPRQVVAEVVSLLHVRAHAKGLTLADEYAGPLPEAITTDPTRLRQILVNLVGNAIKFTETGGVRIVTRLVEAPEGEPSLRYDVIDTGIGIPEDDIDRLFEPFTQADASTSRGFEGTGLGLTISRRLARALGGDVTASSLPGKGSLFSLTVTTGPLAGVRMVESATEAERVRRPRVQSSGSSRDKLCCRVLLADDIPDNQRLISAILKEAGIEVTIARDGREAVDKALAAHSGLGRRHSDPAEPFDAILMDVQMPVLDGHEATRRLRREGYTGPIIALTAHAMRGDRQKCVDAGCNDYLSKPVDRNKLLETLTRWTSRPPAQATGETGTQDGSEDIEAACEQVSCSASD